MRKATDKKIIKKTIIGVITLAFLISPLSLIHAEDYPAGFLGPGYREYLSEKKQNGYYVEVFTKIDLSQKERVNKRNQVEEILAYAYQAAPESANGILAAQFQHKYNTDNLKREIILQRQQRENFASTNLENGFRYLPHSDGKIEYFKDGLLTRVENERVVDEFGNVSIRNSHNYQYNDKRLLTSFEADTKDILGNITHIRQYGMKYTADSLFYGGKNTSANKNITEYFLEETDPAGNKEVTHFYAGSYEGKFLRAFSETIENNIYGKTSFTRSNINYAGNDPERMNSYHEEGIGNDGLAYSLDRTDIDYNDKGQLTGYHEVTFVTQIDGTKTKTTVEAKFKYLGVAHQFGPDVEEADPDRLLESTIVQTVENADSSTRTETSTTKYDYNAYKQLVGASGHSNFNGQEADWFDEETQTYKEGNKFKGTSEIQFEVLYGKPMTKQANSSVSYYGNNISDDELLRIENSTITYDNGLKNNLQRVLASHEHAEITHPLLDPDNSHKEIRDINTTYYYDEKGNFDVERGGAYASGTGSGWEYSDQKGWYGEYTGTISIDYEVILGKVLRKRYYEDMDYK